MTEEKPVTGRWLVAGTAAILAAYLVQALFSVGSGESPTSRAFETIGHHALRKQYDGIPQMRVVTAFDGPTQCAFWNFEATWGRCVGVGIHVRDYRPEHHAVVDVQVRRLAEQIRKPCVLLPTLGLPDEPNLSQALGCNAGRKTFKLRITVASVTVLNEQGKPSNPYMWSVTNRKELYSYHFKGEI